MSKSRIWRAWYSTNNMENARKALQHVKPVRWRNILKHVFSLATFSLTTWALYRAWTEENCICISEKHPNAEERKIYQAFNKMGVDVGLENQRVVRHVKGHVTGDSRKQIDEIQVQHGAPRTKQEERHGWRVGCKTCVKWQSNISGMQCVSAWKESISVIYKIMKTENKKRAHSNEKLRHGITCQ